MKLQCFYDFEAYKLDGKWEWMYNDLVNTNQIIYCLKQKIFYFYYLLVNKWYVIQDINFTYWHTVLLIWICI